MDFIYEQELRAIQEALIRSGEVVTFGPANKQDLLYLKEIGIPDSVCQFYEKAEPGNGVEINDARLWSISNLRIENEQAVPGYIIMPLGYRVIGSTITGDAYCINLNVIDSGGQPAVFLASHDEIYEDSDEEEIRSKIVQVASTFKEFLRKFADSELPADYYDLIQDKNFS